MNIKDRIARGILPTCAAAVRMGPSPLKRIVWERVCSPYIAWRHHEYNIKTKLGFRFQGNTGDMVAQYIYYFGVWEPAVTALIRSLPLQGRAFIDIGAHLGWYSLLASRCVGESGRVVSFEASPRTYAGLLDNLALNNCTNVRAVQAAVWREHAELDLYEGPSGNSGRTTLSMEFARSSGTVDRTYRVDAAPLSSLLRPEEVAGAAVVKIDVEGVENEVLAGMQDLIASFPRDVTFLMELTPGSHQSGPDILDFFRNEGFRVYRIENRYDKAFYLSPPKSTVAELHGGVTHQTDVIIRRDPLPNH